MKGALANGVHVGSAQCAATPDPCADAMTRVERALAEVLAGVLRVDPVPLDRDFFEELGADSLQMAHFCARVRKRGDLPSVSMKDIYAHPTIRSLAAAIADVAPPPARSLAEAVPEVPTPTNAREYILCGALQFFFYLGYSCVGVLAAIEGYQWMVAGTEGLESYLRLVAFSGVAFLVVLAVPIAAKWLLVGRWKPTKIRIWSLAYIRFWIVKTLIRSNPGVYLFVGSPLYGLYLRALGAKVGPRVVILSRDIPVCTDLLAIGAGTVIRRDAIFLCYRAQGGRIEIGPVSLGRDVFVGEMTVLDINTSMGDGAQLGHASSLHSGQSVPARERWHGSPARRTDTNYLRVAPARCSRLRRARYAVLTLIGILFVWAPLLEAGFGVLFLAVSSLVERVDPSIQSSTGISTGRGILIQALAFSVVLFFGAVLVGLLVVGIVPRALGVFIKPDRVYPLYGFHYAVHRLIAGLGRLRFFPLLFGDSSYAVHFLQWVGYRLSPIMQTGSNFGSEVTASYPLLTSVGTGTMIADGLSVINDEISSSSFRVSRAAIGRQNFVGNYVTYPSRRR
jgi:non-ribosomal peptide synthetase-like protein